MLGRRLYYYLVSLVSRVLAVWMGVYKMLACRILIIDM